MKQRGFLTARYALIQAFYCMGSAAILGFASVYLLDAGFSSALIGILIAAAGLISVVFQPALASYADKPESVSVKRILVIFSAVTLLFAIVLLVLYKKSYWLTGLFYGGTILVFQVMAPFITSIGTESINQGKKVDYGIAKGMGSVAYGVGSYVLGFVVGKMGTIAIPVIMVFVFGLLLLSAVIYPFEKRSVIIRKEETKQTKNVSFFKRYRSFPYIMAGCFLLYISHQLLNTYLFQIIEVKGGGSAEMGIAIAIGSFVELPVLFGYGIMVKKFKNSVWFRISGIFFAIKAIGSWIVPNVFSLYGVQVLQIFAWGLISVSSVYYVNEWMEKQDAIKGQACLTAIYTLSSVVASFVGGIMIDGISVNAMLIVSAAVSATGMIILLFSVKER